MTPTRYDVSVFRPSAVSATMRPADSHDLPPGVFALRGSAKRIIILLLLAAMVATFGFWATLKGILGAIGVIILLCLLGVLFLSFLAAWILRR